MVNIRWALCNDILVQCATLSNVHNLHATADAKDWFAFNNIYLYGANENPTQKSWTDSPKVYAHLYIDDAAMGCFLSYDPNFHSRPYVDWKETASYLHARGLITYEQYNEIMKSYE